MSNLIPREQIESKIFIMREMKVMLDRDIAELYGVETKYVNRQVRRNITRFPNEFMFRLTAKEKRELVTKCHRFNRLKHSTSLPYAFTEHGALMLANVIKSPTAVEMSVAIVKAFIKLREMALSYKELQKKIEDMEGKYDKQFGIVFKTIKQLLEPPPVPKRSKRRIGFVDYEGKMS